MEGPKGVAALHRLPPSLPWRAYRLPATNLVLVEWLHRPNPNNPPPNPIRFPATPEFARRPSGVSFPDAFGASIPGADDLYARLLSQKRASTFPKVAAHLALMLSALGGCRTLCLMSDDDGWDFGCLALDGIFCEARFDAGKGENLHIDAVGNLIVERRFQDPRLIHQIAEAWARSWHDSLSKLFGFNGDASALGLIEIDRTPQPPDTDVSSGKPWWCFWRRS
jgi:hypothetical protein